MLFEFLLLYYMFIILQYSSIVMFLLFLVLELLCCCYDQNCCQKLFVHIHLFFVGVFGVFGVILHSAILTATRTQYGDCYICALRQYTALGYLL